LWIFDPTCDKDQSAAVPWRSAAGCGKKKKGDHRWPPFKRVSPYVRARCVKPIERANDDYFAGLALVVGAAELVAGAAEPAPIVIGAMPIDGSIGLSASTVILRVVVFHGRSLTLPSLSVS